MRTGKNRFIAMLGTSLIAMSFAVSAHAEEAADNAASEDGSGGSEDATTSDNADSEIVVVGTAVTYNSNQASEAMMSLQPPITSPLSMIKDLPGVDVHQGDTFGFDDWSTTVALRGFQTNLGEQQIGITIDGLPNGGSNYGGGSKANRYIDSMNIGTVQVAQGTADIGSLSNEALGGTLNFTTSDPLTEQRVRASFSIGQFDALRYYMRYDTGDLDGIRAWFSASHQEATDWVGGSAKNHRDNFAAKFTTDGRVRLTGYFDYDDTYENNYDQVYSAAQFAAMPHTDGLTAQWVGIPFIDQVYRPGWATLRTNLFEYLKAETEFDNGIELKAAAYYHHNKGRGDWIPPYIVDVTNDGAGNPESELTVGSHVLGGAFLGQIFYVDANNVALTPIAGCTSSLTFPYGGTSNPAYDPSCYAPGAIPVMSFRHTHYLKERYGGTFDASWTSMLGFGENVLRAGLWYEGGNRQEYRDWHKVNDARVGMDFVYPAYWVQYSRKYPQSTVKWYAEDQLSFGALTATFGIKQFFNKIERQDLFNATPGAKIDSTSRLLFSGGLKYELTGGLTAFAGYSENFKALNDLILERPEADISNLKPETAKNIEAGMRYRGGPVTASATYFKSVFDNRVIFLSNSVSTGPDYLIGTNGTYFNAGGIDSEGFELLANLHVLQGLNLFGSYTHTKATYRGTGDSAVDAAVGITPGNYVAGIPKDMFALSADWTNGIARAGVSGKHTGKRFVNQSNSWEADSNVVVDAYVGVRGEGISDMFKALDFSLVANNLFDESYLGGISGNYAWIGAPRTVSFTVTADF